MHRRSMLAGLAGVVLALGCSKGGSSAAAGQPRIAVIPKGTTHEFWKSVHAGAVKASQELRVEIVWKGPLKEDDLRAQIELVQSFVAQRVSGIVLAPLSDKALVLFRWCVSISAIVGATGIMPTPLPTAQ